jgi:hypothetical protein
VCSWCLMLGVQGRNFLRRPPIPILPPFYGAVPCPQTVREVLGEDEVWRVAAVLHAAAVQEFAKLGDEVGRIPRTSRCWAIAARCVFDVVWHIGIWLVIRCGVPGSDARARRSVDKVLAGVRRMVFQRNGSRSSNDHAGRPVVALQGSHASRRISRSSSMRYATTTTEQAVRANRSFAVLWLAGIYPCPGTTWESGSHLHFDIGWFFPKWFECFVVRSCVYYNRFPNAIN